MVRQMDRVLVRRLLRPALALLERPTSPASMLELVRRY